MAAQARRVFSAFERAKLVCWYEETKSASMAARRYRSVFNAEPPQMDIIRKWHNHFMETGSVTDSFHVDENKLRASPVLQPREQRI
ncbi:hypothetical protein QR680_010979 [Steinernema hermaphroditum]|uniref:DUF4817 domain-containing protein n=1 Tax=Steinernema hermaphroditum TaxID=289476 RepID=A0AA39IQP6_9BILA|nr:hypothetical protein QR680_010979 [Steinernema hermaphroditum]